MFALKNSVAATDIPEVFERPLTRAVVREGPRVFPACVSRMPRKLPPHVDRNPVKGHTYLSFRIGKGARIRLPNDPTSQEFREAYAAAMAGETLPKPTIKKDAPGTIGALITSYKQSGQFKGLGETSKAGYMSRLEAIRVDHGHCSVAGLTKDRIKSFILDPLADRPGGALDTIKKLRILNKHKIDKGWLKYDPSVGIKRPKGEEIRAWTDAELAAFERRWPIGTKQRTAYASMLNMGTLCLCIQKSRSWRKGFR